MKDAYKLKIQKALNKSRFVVLLSDSFEHNDFKEFLKENNIEHVLVNLRTIDSGIYASLGIVQTILAQNPFKAEVQEKYSNILNAIYPKEDLKNFQVKYLLNDIFDLIETRGVSVVYLYPTAELHRMIFFLEYLDEIAEYNLYQKIKFVLLSKHNDNELPPLRCFDSCVLDDIDGQELAISYKRNQVSINIVENQLIPSLRKRGIPYFVDTENLKDMRSITDFEKSFKFKGNVLLIVSKEYLYSEDCMYEVSCVLNSGNWQDRLFVINLEDFNRQDTQLYTDVYNHWRKQYLTLETEYSKLNYPVNQIIIKRLDKIEVILSHLNDFFSILMQFYTSSLTVLARNDFERLFQLMGYDIPKVETYDTNFKILG